MADTLSAIFDAALGALKLKAVSAGPAPVGGTDTLSKALDGDELRVVLSGTGASALTWTALTLQNSWVNYDAVNYANAEYAKDEAGVVHLRGVIKDGAVGVPNVIATLPAGFVPAKRHVFAVVADSAIEVVDVLPNGQIQLVTSASHAFLSLCGLSFDTA